MAIVNTSTSTTIVTPPNIGGTAQTPSPKPTTTPETPSPLQGLASRAEARGGVLASHSVALQELATDKQVCVFIRGVNTLSTDLIREGYGTKDMAIKGKSATIPPISALIPRDQTYGKKGADEKEATKFSAYNEKSIAVGTAKAVDLTLSSERIKDLAKKTDLTLQGTWIDAGPDAPPEQRSGLMTGKADGREFTFFGEKQTDGSVKIFHADKQGDSFVKGKPFEVMANRDGKAVTADYDLALIAPRMQDYGSEHTRPLKMTSMEEVSIRTGTKKDDEVAVTPEVVRDMQAHGKEAPVTMKASELFDAQVYIAEAGTRVEYEAGGPMKDMGNLSNFTRDLIPELNEACGATGGREVFHHSDDAGNPFSVEADNYPMTVILPTSSSLPTETEHIQVIENRAGLIDLFQTLKDSGFMPIGSYRWGEDLMAVRSTAFEEARSTLEAFLPNRGTALPDSVQQAILENVPKQGVQGETLGGPGAQTLPLEGAPKQGTTGQPIDGPGAQTIPLEGVPKQGTTGQPIDGPGPQTVPLEGVPKQGTTGQPIDGPGVRTVPLEGVPKQGTTG